MRIRTALVLAALALSLTACGSAGDGEGVATAGGDGAAPSAGSTLSDAEARLKFGECMREHGIDIPDPDPDAEGIQIQLPEGVDPEDAKAATEECEQFLPDGGAPPKADPERIEEQRLFAECMRENGIEGFPDPDPETGGIIVEGDAFDPSGAEFKAAEEACAQYKPTGPEGEDSEDGEN
ncbi:hypothetical protein [Phytomonospora endophytica]|uniref:Secreted protein n=1 Tax=Phytomonospora endophytica TaxID=714109 RepID=A0A841FX69_9ACTN|nr:hypothetical protein [Phytomonospora endophytica]MBB6038132.1 hypothetical protein [Phytomonospora endophytica]GIG67405.1 hypothetical protein Pen01_37000 [Phytomonospora endophytica]